MGLAIGFSLHTGWAAAVVLDGAAVTARHRVTLIAGDERFAYHLAVELNASLTKAAALIAGVRADAVKHAGEFFDQELAGKRVVVAMPRPKRPLPELEKILQAHPLLHAAEGALYREAIVEAAEARGLRVVTPEPGDVPPVGKIGPPWGKDQRDAAALAWAAQRKPARRGAR